MHVNQEDNETGKFRFGSVDTEDHPAVKRFLTNLEYEISRQLKE